MNPAYDINQILADLEQDIMKSYKKNMSKHTQEEIAAGFKWEMWQATKIKDLRDYKQEVQSLINGTMSKVIPGVDDILTGSYQEGMDAVDKLAESMGMTDYNNPRFDGYQMNRNKLNALVNSINNDMNKMGASVLRLTDDKYRQILFKTQFAYTSGSMTLYQAIDQASKDFLTNGINSIQYADGKRVNIASYAEMAIRSASKQAYLTGEGSKLDEWGIYTVQVTSYGACSDTCLPWQGKVYIDDVYSSGKSDGEYPLLSTAMSEGLYHPNCRHTHGPFFEGISTLPKEQDVNKIRELAQAESQQRLIERQIRKWKRVEEGSLDDSNKERASFKVKSWQRRMREHLEANPQLRRAYSREKTYGIPNKPTNFVEKPPVITPVTPVEVPVKELTFADKVHQIKSNYTVLTDGRVVPELSQVQSAGRVVLDHLKGTRQQAWDDFLEAKKTFEQSDYAKLEKRLKEYRAARGNTRYLDTELKYYGFKDISELDNLIEQTRMQLRDMSADGNNLSEMVNTAHAKYRGKQNYNISDLKLELSRVRDIGLESQDMKKHLPTRSPLNKILKEAYDAYPTEWIDKSVSKGSIHVYAADRGYYMESWKSEVYLSGSSDFSKLSTALHELGHRFESTMPDVIRLESDFYVKRTAGESLEWCGPGYRRDEVSRKDNFLDIYMGKDYKGTAYELVSMGFEMAYTDPTRLWDDEDFAEFIYGILATI